VADKITGEELEHKGLMALIETVATELIVTVDVAVAVHPLLVPVTV
jgi:hypothetical protein